MRREIKPRILFARLLIVHVQIYAEVGVSVGERPKKIHDK